ncbi:MAG: glycosyltransferase family 4 protein [Herpetosiphonaceae bacterium]|nr:glycosyltransferase family 4 protein [Herpetosiphonaceae bacterium]
MNVAVVLEYRFSRTPDGAVWTHTMFSYSFWTRYLTVFDHVKIVARIQDVPSVPDGWKRVDGECVACCAIPYYVGPRQYVLVMRQVRRAVREAVTDGDAVIVRLSSAIASPLLSMLRTTGHPYGAEVVGDPYDVFAPGAVKHPLRFFFRSHFSAQLRAQCAGACAVAYVTEQALQRRYPVQSAAFSTHYSSIELPCNVFKSARRATRDKEHVTRLVTVGSLAQLYKAPDVLIDAVGMCIRQGLNLELVIVGDGKHRLELEDRAKQNAIAQRVHFVGQLAAGDAVYAQLDQADLFIMPSRTEGLPRAMIEAMARGLPCIGTTVGGIPELLPPEDVVPPGDARALAQKIAQVVGDPVRMDRMAARNRNKAQDYRDEVLSSRRLAFYQYVRHTTEAWLRMEQQA